MYSYAEIYAEGYVYLCIIALSSRLPGLMSPSEAPLTSADIDTPRPHTHTHRDPVNISKSMDSSPVPWRRHEEFEIASEGVFSLPPGASPPGYIPDIRENSYRHSWSGNTRPGKQGTRRVDKDAVTTSSQLSGTPRRDDQLSNSPCRRDGRGWSAGRTSVVTADINISGRPRCDSDLSAKYISARYTSYNDNNVNDSRPGINANGNVDKKRDIFERRACDNIQFCDSAGSAAVKQDNGDVVSVCEGSPRLQDSSGISTYDEVNVDNTPFLYDVTNGNTLVENFTHLNNASGTFPLGNASQVVTHGNLDALPVSDGVCYHDNLETLPAAGDACQSRHSESNDSGFDSERKQSQGNETGLYVEVAGNHGNDRGVCRSGQHTQHTQYPQHNDNAIHMSVVSSADFSVRGKSQGQGQGQSQGQSQIHGHDVSICLADDLLTPVTEV